VCGTEIIPNSLCPKCGTELKDGMRFCLKCGTEIPSTQKSSTPTPQSTNIIERGSYPTTDTGTADEITILNFSELLWKVSLVLGGLSILIYLIVGLQNTNVFVMSLLYILLTAFALFMVYVLRAFLRVIHNISINLHEINMKLK
jgi:hypothetical protein